MKFSEVIGNQPVKEALKTGARGGRIPHAQLFAGCEGGGNLAMALAYTQYIFCSNRSEEDSCGECESCRKVSKFIHPDLHFAFPVNTTKKVKKDPVSNDFMENWRNILTKNPYLSISDWVDECRYENKILYINVHQCDEIVRKLNFKPYQAEYKVMIIWLPENFFHAAVPKMLKIVEEPPDKTLFLFVSNHPEEILNTITSRTQLVKLAHITDFEMMDALINLNGADMQKANEAVNIADGDYNAAKKLIRNEEDTQSLTLYINYMRYCWEYKVPEMLAMSDDIHALGKEKQKKMLSYFLHMTRESLMKTASADQLARTTSSERSFMERFAQAINPESAQAMAALFEQAMQRVDRNAHAKIMFSNISVKIADMFSAIRKGKPIVSAKS